MTKRTFGGTSRKRKRVSGFRVRMRSHTGRRVIKSRRQCVLIQGEELLKAEDKKVEKELLYNFNFKWPYLRICV